MSVRYSFLVLGLSAILVIEGPGSIRGAIAHSGPQLPAANDSIQSKNVDKLVLVSGMVRNKRDQAPLAWTNVIVQGTTDGTTTTQSGQYNLKVPRGSTVVFSYVGYVTERIRIFNGGVYDVELQPVIFRIDLPEVSDDLQIVSKPVRSPKRRIKKTDGNMVSIEEMPNFAYGGFMGLAIFIREKAQIYVDETGEKGSVKIGFTISSGGQAVDPYIIDSNNSNLDQVAMDIITGITGWIPGRQVGIPVDVRVSLDMNF